MREIAPKDKKSLLVETNSDFVKTRRNTRKRRLVIYSTLFLVVIGAMIYFAWYPKFLIKMVSIDGNRVLSNDKILLSTQKYLHGRFLLVLPNKNAFIFSGSDLEKHLKTEYPVIKNVQIRQRIPDQVYVTITERQPHALWCNVGSVDCVFIDVAGYAYDIAPYFSRPLFLVYELPGAGLTKQVLDVESFNFSEGIYKKMLENKIIVQKIKPVDKGVFEFNLLLNDKSSQTVFKTSAELGVDESMSRFITLLNSDDVKNHSDKLLKKVDVRFGNQVVYTFY